MCDVKVDDHYKEGSVVSFNKKPDIVVWQVWVEPANKHFADGHNKIEFMPLWQIKRN